MRQSEVFGYYKKNLEDIATSYEYIKSRFSKSYEEFADELMTIRGYTDSFYKDFFVKNQIGYCNIDNAMEIEEFNNDTGIVNASGHFLLQDRFIIPIKDLSGKLLALVGYLDDNKKYITTPTPFFSKENLFFNFSDAYKLSFEKYDGLVILVEGIFDCLSLSAIGMPAIATMGADVSEAKGELLRLFKKVIGVPDDDAVGRKSLNRYTKRGWKVPSNTTMIKLVGGTRRINGIDVHCKDLDNLISWGFEPDDVKEMLLDFRDSKEEIETLEIEW